MKFLILVLLVSVVVGAHVTKARGKGKGKSHSHGHSHSHSPKSSGSSHNSSGSSHNSSGSTDEYGDLSCYVCKGVDDPLTCSSDDDNLKSCKLRYTQCVTKKIEKGGVVTYDLRCERPNYKPCLNQSEHANGKNVTEHAKGKNVTEHAKGKKNVTTTCCDTSGCNAGVPSCSVDGGCGVGECRTDAGTGMDYCYCGEIAGFPNGTTNGPNCVANVCGPNNECEQDGQSCATPYNPGPFGPYIICEDVDE